MGNRSSETISIKQIGLNEFDQFYDFFERNIRKLFTEFDPQAIEIMLESDSRKELRRKLKNNQITIIVGLIGDEIASSIFSDSLHYGGVVELHWLMTANKHQKKGLASAILEFIEKTYLDQGAHLLRLGADKRNLDFYQKRGYEIIGKIPEHYFGTEDYLMAKKLQKAKPENYLK